VIKLFVLDSTPENTSCKNCSDSRPLGHPCTFKQVDRVPSDNHGVSTNDATLKQYADGPISMGYSVGTVVALLVRMVAYCLRCSNVSGVVFPSRGLGVVF
jgi:hypothetical protein